jgi:hypothetical protein
VQLVVLLLVLRLGDRRELREGDEVREGLEALLEVDDDRLVVRGLDALPVLVTRVGAGVVLAALEEVLLVRRAVAGEVLVEGALGREGDVLGRDR